MDLRIRTALRTDVPKINEILNYAIENTNYNLNLNARSSEDAYAWFDSHVKEDYPVVTAVIDSQVVGWASLSHFRAYSGYDTTAEVSVYVERGFRHKGIGTMLLTELERRAKRFHMLIAVITDNNTASLSLHSRCGFIPVCTLREIAFKNKEYISITLMNKKL